MSIQVGGLPVRRDDVTLVEDGERSLLVVADSAGRHALNSTARAIWELCDGTTLAEEMTVAICQVFDVAPRQAEDDVRRALDQLTEVGLVVWSSTPRSNDT